MHWGTRTISCQIAPEAAKGPGAAAAGFAASAAHAATATADTAAQAADAAGPTAAGPTASISDDAAAAAARCRCWHFRSRSVCSVAATGSDLADATNATLRRQALMPPPPLPRPICIGVLLHAARTHALGGPMRAAWPLAASAWRTTSPRSSPQPPLAGAAFRVSAHCGLHRQASSPAGCKQPGRPRRRLRPLQPRSRATVGRLPRSPGLPRRTA